MFERASDVSSNSDIYASENLRQALELCEKQEKMINEMKEELTKLKEDIQEDDDG
jgi:serine phosphatase RsbU (regulator of sigma subunit)